MAGAWDQESASVVVQSPDWPATRRGKADGLATATSQLLSYNAGAEKEAHKSQTNFAASEGRSREPLWLCPFPTEAALTQNLPFLH